MLPLENEQRGRRYADVIHAHLQLDDPEQIDLDGVDRGLVVFWSDETPVEQMWITPDVSVSHKRILETLRRASARSAAIPASGVSPSVSLVICSRDRPLDLQRCLASLPRQVRRPDELIVVDSASRGAETRAVVEAAGARYVREERAGLNIARNAGWRASSCDLVAYTDDDTELHPAWLERTVAAFDRDDILSVAGLVLPSALDTKAQWLFERGWSFGRGFERRDFGPAFFRDTGGRGCPAWRIGAGANMAFRKAAAARVGLFDERLDVGAAGCSGDSEFWHRILATGATCRYEPSAVVFHHHRAQMEGLARQLRHYMRGHVAALLVQFERSRDPGDLMRAFGVLPAHYGGRLLARLGGHGRAQDAFLLQQIAGAVCGVAYYLQARRAP